VSTDRSARALRPPGAVTGVSPADRARLAIDCFHAILANVKGTVLAGRLSATMTRARIARETARLWTAVHDLFPAAGAGLGDECLDGCRVAVIGVGSEFGFPFVVHALGAELVVCIDPGVRSIDRGAERDFMRGVADALPWEGARRRARAYLDAHREGTHAASCIVDDRAIRFDTARLEDASALDRSAPYDFFFSNGVMSHVKDVEACFARMRDLLKPGGGMAHSLALMNHGMFARWHPQMYLTFSPALYRLMSSGVPAPNRCPSSELRRIARRAGFPDLDVIVKERHSREEAAWAMRHAHPSVRADTEEDMSVKLATLAVRASFRGLA
jgi:hypothetical protein